MDFVRSYSRPRRQFGQRPCNFAVTLNKDPKYPQHADIKPEPAVPGDFVLREPVDHGVQCRPDVSEHEVNTDTIHLVSKAVLHIEGGWGKEMANNDREPKINYCRRITKSEPCISHVKNLAEVVLQRVRENNAIDIYEEYFVEDKSDSKPEPPSARTLSTFRDPTGTNRAATCVSWYPDQASKIAVAYSSNGTAVGGGGSSVSGGDAASSSLDSFIWDVENPTKADLALSPSSPLWCLQYHPKDSHLLVGGSLNGIVSFWDTRKGSLPLGVSSIERSHRDPVYSVKWVQSKSGTEFFTTSTDGQVLWWDTRKLDEPTDAMPIMVKDAVDPMGGVVLDYESSMPTKFMVGTEQGIIVNCNRKAKNADERILSSFRGHHGPIYALQRNPFFPKYFMTAGDWTVRVWNEDVSTSIMTTKYHSSYLTDAAWSPTRPGVLITARLDGSVDVWDFVAKQNDATLSMPVSSVPINTLSIHSHGRLVAVGGRDGAVTLLDLVEGLYTPQSDERKIVADMLERETKREKMLETRSRAKGKANQQSVLASRFEELEVVGDDVLRQAEKEFFDLVRQAEDDQRALLEGPSSTTGGSSSSSGGGGGGGGQGGGGRASTSVSGGTGGASRPVTSAAPPTTASAAVNGGANVGGGASASASATPAAAGAAGAGVGAAPSTRSSRAGAAAATAPEMEM